MPTSWSTAGSWGAQVDTVHVRSKDGDRGLSCPSGNLDDDAELGKSVVECRSSRSGTSSNYLYRHEYMGSQK